MVKSVKEVKNQPGKEWKFIIINNGKEVASCIFFCPTGFPTCYDDNKVLDLYNNFNTGKIIYKEKGLVNLENITFNYLVDF